MKNGQISQVDAQVINKKLEEDHAYTGGWVQLYGLKTPEKISQYLRDKHGIVIKPSEIVGML